MKAFLTLLFFLLFLQPGLKAQTKPSAKFPGTPFQGTKQFCDYLKPLRFDVSIQGYNVTITKFYNKEKQNTVKGTFKKGKLYTNDPIEKQFHAAGKYYKIIPDYFSINNLEGGDYETYEVCK